MKTNSTLLYTLSLSVCLLIGLNTYAQPAGFQGKRTIIGLEFNNFFALGMNHENFGLNEDNQIYGNTEDMYFTYVFKPTISIGRIINRKASVHLIGRACMRKASLFQTSVTENGESLELYPTELAPSTTIYAGLRYRWFKGDNLNPMGAYRQFTVEYAMTDYAFTDNNFLSRDSDGNIGVYQPGENSGSAIVISYGFGVQKAISNGSLFNLGVEIGGSIPLSSDYINRLDWDNMNRNNLLNIVLGYSFGL